MFLLCSFGWPVCNDSLLGLTGMRNAHGEFAARHIQPGLENLLSTGRSREVLLRCRQLSCDEF